MPFETRKARIEFKTWRAAAAGFSAILVGIGLARFAYTPLVPALIESGWFSVAAAAYLAAGNLIGYLAGAITGPALARRYSAPAILRAMMILAAASFLATAGPWPFAWWMGWRFLSGLAGGVLMTVAGPFVLQSVPPDVRGLIGGIVFTGVGAGIAFSGAVLPPLLGYGLAEAWWVLGLFSALLTVMTWRWWPKRSTGSESGPRPSSDLAAPTRRALRRLYAQYGLIAVGLTPHMVFLVDFVARGRGAGIDVGGVVWVAFGVGALAGPASIGWISDRVGRDLTLKAALVIQALGVSVLCVSSGQPSLFISAFVVGAFVPGVVPLALGRVHDLIPEGSVARSDAWRIATISFAAGQAGAAYGFSVLFSWTQNFELLFGVGACALATAFALGLTGAARTPCERFGVTFR